MSIETTANGFNPLAERMDLSRLLDKTFVVAVNRGHPDLSGLLVTSMHGPFSFDEMLGEVGRMHLGDEDAKVVLLEKDVAAKVKWLDAKTIEYIQFNYADLIIERMLNEQFDKPYTCEAGLVEDSGEELSSDVDEEATA